MTSSSSSTLAALVATCGVEADGRSSIRVYDPEAGRATLAASRALERRAEGDARCVAWSPSNGALCAGTTEAGCVLMKPDLSDLGRVPERAVAGEGEVHAVDFSAGSRYLVAGGTGEARVWDLKRKREHRVFSGHTGGVATVKYGMFGRVVGSGGHDGTVLVRDVESGATKAKLSPPTLSGVTSIDFSEYSPQHLVSACADGTVRLWDAEVGELQSTLTVRGSECYQVEFSPVAPGLVGYVKSDGRVVLQDVASPTPSGALTFRSTQVTCMAWHYSGFGLVVGTSNGVVTWLDTRKISGGADIATCKIYDVKAHEGAVNSLSWQKPVPHSFQVESTPARGDNLPDSPMTPVAEKSNRLLHGQRAHTPPAAALAREELKLVGTNPIPTTADVSSLLDAAVEKFGGDLSARVRDVHLELLRQHQLQQEETARMFADMQHAQLDMAAVIAALRIALENSRSA